MEKIDYVFITGFGRSGTSFLSHLLSKCDGVNSFHEYIGNREFELLSWYLGKKYTIPYLKQQKLIIEKNNLISGKFVDVNGAYRNCIEDVIEVFNPLKTFHLIRDPRDLVRSLYTRRDNKKVHFIPKNEDDIKWWINSDKFSQICWNWNTETKKLLDTNIDIIYFEKIISNYNYFKVNILDKIDSNMDKAVWKKIVSVKRNRTKPKVYRYLYSKIKGKQFVSERLPKYEKWPDLNKNIFKEICGETMKKLDYEWI